MTGPISVVAGDSRGRDRSGGPLCRHRLVGDPGGDRRRSSRHLKDPRFGVGARQRKPRQPLFCGRRSSPAGERARQPGALALATAWGGRQRRLQRRLELGVLAVHLQPERLVDVMEAGLVVLPNVQHVAGRIGVPAPGVSQGGYDVLDLLGGVDLDGHPDAEVVPVELEHRVIVGELRERERQPFAVRRGDHLGPGPQDIEIVAVAARSRHVGVSVEDDGPAVGGRLRGRRRDQQQVVSPRGDRLSQEDDLPVEADLGDRAAVRGPQGPGRGEGLRQRSPAHRRSRVVERDGRDPDLLGQTGRRARRNGRHRGRRAARPRDQRRDQHRPQGRPGEKSHRLGTAD